MTRAKDEPPGVEAQPAGGHAVSGTNRYQLALSAFLFPYAGHLLLAGLVAAGAFLLGYPKTALAFAATVVPVDMAQQWVIRRWLRRSAGVDTAKGMGRLAVLSAVRVSAYMAPLAVTAVQLHGAGPEMYLFALTATALLGMAFSAAIVSRAVFWGFASPILVAFAAVAASLGSWSAGAGGLFVLAGLCFLMFSLSQAVSKGTRQWIARYDANVAMIPELKAARARAEGARAEADAAREAATRADAAKTSYLATMSQEIRTPMNGVLGMAQLLRQDEADAKKRDRLDLLLESGQQLLSLLDDVQDISNIDAGRLEIRAGPENLRLLLDRVVGLWDMRAERQGVALNLDLDDSVPDTVMVDAARLKQVLSNLIANALKFTPDGSVEVAAAAERLDAGRVLLKVAVRDHGPGIPAEQLPGLFQRFGQGDDTPGGGSLALAIAREVTELMGGRIRVESVIGRGSTFEVAIPLALPAGAASEPPVRLRQARAGRAAKAPGRGPSGR